MSQSTPQPSSAPDEFPLAVNLPREPAAPAGPQGLFWACWAATAAFITYFAMYGFRKPFTAAAFSENFGGYDLKTIVVIAQVAGYTISKFIGIKVIAEMSPPKRAFYLAAFIAVAQIALILFGLVPRPWNAICLFLNGLPLGMVFGLVMGFLEGRRVTELLAAGLCASFIVADGVTKSVGAWLLGLGIQEDWMPAVAGFLSVPAFALGVWMLVKIPKPTSADELARAPRQAMTKAERWALFSKYAVALVPLVIMYLALTVLRSLRADFTPELWKALGATAVPSDYTTTELIIAITVTAFSALIVFIKNNRAAFFASLGMAMAGFALLGLVFWAQRAGSLSPMMYMTLLGLGLYLPYIAMHTSVFERLLAMTRERGNLGFLMYLADSFGYLGYVAVLLGRGVLRSNGNVLDFFTTSGTLMTAVCAVCVIIAGAFFLVRGSAKNPV